jgi:hypothetical protein
MQRNKFVSAKRQPVMTWGEVGDKITNKTTGEQYTLHTKQEDGWVVSKHHHKGVQGGGLHKFTWEELGSQFTDPEDEKKVKEFLDQQISKTMKQLLQANMDNFRGLY